VVVVAEPPKGSGNEIILGHHCQYGYSRKVKLGSTHRSSMSAEQCDKYMVRNGEPFRPLPVSVHSSSLLRTVCGSVGLQFRRCYT